MGKLGVTAYLGEVMACSNELEIDAGPSPGEFITRVVNSPSGGEPKAVVQLDVEGLLRDRDGLETMVLAAHPTHGRPLPPPPEHMAETATFLACMAHALAAHTAAAQQISPRTPPRAASDPSHDDRR